MLLVRNKIFLLIGIFFSILFFLMLGIFGSIHFLLDKDFVKGIITEQVAIYTKLSLQYDKVDSIVFPLPGVRITGITILDEDSSVLSEDSISENKTIATIEKLDIYWNVWALFQRKFELDSINLSDGKIFLHRSEDGNFPILTKFKSDAKEIDEIKEKLEDESANSPDDILPLLPEGIRIERFALELKDDVSKRTEIITIDNFSVGLARNSRKLNVDLLAAINANPVILNSNIQFVENDWSYESARANFQFTCLELELNQYKEYLALFPKGNFENAKLAIDFKIVKKEKDEVSLELSKLSLNELLTNSKKLIDPVNFESKLIFSKDKSLLQIKELEYKMGNHSQVSLNANLLMNNQFKIDANIDSHAFDLDSALSWINQFTKVDLTKIPKPKNLPNQRPREVIPKQRLIAEQKNATDSKDQSSKDKNITVNLDLKKLNLSGKFINSLNGKIEIRNQMVFIKSMNISLYDGKINTTGNINLSKRGQNSIFNIGTKKLNLAKLLKQLGKDNLISGNLDSDTELKMGLANGSDLTSTIDAKTKFKIHKGELIGYANFIKPVADIGKLINFEASNEGKSTAFHSIKGDVHFAKGNLLLKEFHMLGVGVDAVGSGVYKKNGSVDMKFQASLSGRIGQAVKIPIIYKGIFGKNFAYLDPVWLASVYAGTIFFAGPAGTIVGGLAGSAASDTVHKTKDAVKGTFSSAKNFLFGSEEKEDEDTDD